LVDPEEYRVHVLPQDFREKIAKKIRDFIIKMTVTHRDNNPIGVSRMVNSYNSVIKFLLDGNQDGTINEFTKRNKKLDKIRNENFLELYPELSFLYKE
jgi:hypothetical protein